LSGSFAADFRKVESFRREKVQVVGAVYEKGGGFEKGEGGL
jgi:hypothetical protein